MDLIVTCYKNNVLNNEKQDWLLLMRSVRLRTFSISIFRPFIEPTNQLLFFIVLILSPLAKVPKTSTVIVNLALCRHTIHSCMQLWPDCASIVTHYKTMCSQLWLFGWSYPWIPQTASHKSYHIKKSHYQVSDSLHDALFIKIPFKGQTQNLPFQHIVTFNWCFMNC